MAQYSHGVFQSPGRDTLPSGLYWPGSHVGHVPALLLSQPEL